MFLKWHTSLDDAGHKEGRLVQRVRVERVVALDEMLKTFILTEIKFCELPF